MIFEVSVEGRDYRVELQRGDAPGQWKCQLNGEQIVLDATTTAPGVLSLILGGTSYEVLESAGQQQLAISGRRYAVEVRDPRAWKTRRARAGSGDGPKKIVAPMPGKVVRVIASEGSEVEQGAPVIVIEAMKMQNELKSPKKGTVAKVLAVEGAPVNAGDVLAVIE